MADKKTVDSDWEDVNDWEDVTPPNPNIKKLDPNETSSPWKAMLRTDTAAPAREALKGYAKGAIADLPGSIGGMLSSIANTIADPGKTLKELPSNVMEMGHNFMNTYRQAGSHSEEFGRMMGQLTGQPLVTEGMAKGVPMLKSPTGKVLENTGKVMNKYQPLSGMLPRFADMRTLRNIERYAGGKIRDIGASMRVPFKEGEVVHPTSPIMEGEIIPPAATALPPSNVVNYSDVPTPKLLGENPSSMLSDIYKRGASSDGQFFETLKREAIRHNMTVPDYIQSLRNVDNSNFTMPSANMPRVR